ncbi:MAG: RagB/SusD family nutrient uptake outer membrane protein, partial [Chitinophagaceae bacterium]|nr:RagB/SusD family nutrient uptake outer membrane protein [Chitinophagaceae bacterium]
SYPLHDGSGTATFPHHYIYKWFDSTAVVSTLKSDLNYTLFRLADGELMYAEASNRAEGSPNATALQSVNDIRKRAGLAPIGAMSQANFEHEVWSQRYFELCFENKMWFDIVRTQKIRNDATGNWDDFVGSQMIPGVTFAEKNLLFPISLVDLNANPNLAPNNPGWPDH